ncbi:uncharacterized protein L969DRAFT_47197 [Mixia osmundae IAM 14324]|uniref:N-acetyltransferase domain-containing protein n=1 Tax=Mixia osmundae (strain CBS 9802 / IAM 14324 / JCM 22182 / KY 12970) TaxID=764103 RepID=G7E9Y5_MIXOS|nr:uncharacterized protein L969DRAFT_47197 [Mixia osmundae IAM 14324]KEI40088.1 hypothetical protein L969DRAFT_47197 [Mixia osmundae IAM 14324]GAA99454.1 hypothetical protein E5Q_06153 [Mixia osmundae IAM 14324]
MKNGSLEAAVSNVSLQSPTPPRSDGPAPIIQFRFYAGELDAVQRLIETELSEPYTVYVYHYFLRTWPQLCLLAYDMSSEPAEAVGVIVCKLDVHKSGRRRGYIAMLSIRPDRRKRGIAQQLVKLAIDSIVDEGAEEVRMPLTHLPTARLLHQSKVCVSTGITYRGTDSAI